MKMLKLYLLLSTLAIYGVTVLVGFNVGWNWPAVFFGDLGAMNWRSQFNLDFLIHLVLLATWIQWREGSTPRGFVFGFLSIVMGGMFGFPYIAFAALKAQGDPKRFLLGERAERESSASAESAAAPG